MKRHTFKQGQNILEARCGSSKTEMKPKGQHLTEICQIRLRCSNKFIAASNKCITTSNKKLLVTKASLLVASCY